MEILVIGGSRFVGLSLIRRLGETSHNITVFNRGNRKVKRFPKNVHHVTGDRSDRGAVDKLSKRQFDAVVDMCGYSASDVNGIQKLIKSSSLYLFVSSAVVYDINSTQGSLSEESPRKPHSVFAGYGENKAKAEVCLESLPSVGGAKVVIIRPVYVLGPGNPFYREQYFFDKLSESDRVYLPEDIYDLEVSFVDVEDVVDLMVACLANYNQFQPLEYFNSSGVRPVRFERLLFEAGETLGIMPRIVYEGGDNSFPFPRVSFRVSGRRARERFSLKPRAIHETMRRFWNRSAS